MRSAFLAAGLFAIARILHAQAAPTITAVRNGGSFDNRLAPGLLAHVSGDDLGTNTSVAVIVGGKPAKVTIAFPTQLTIQIPVDAPLGATTIQVGKSAPFDITLTQYAPALFSAAFTGKGLVSASHMQTGDAVNALNPARPVETLSLYAVGLGPAGPAAAQPTITVGGQPAAIQSSGLAPAQIAIYQVVFTLPLALPAGNQPIALSIGGASSQTLTLPIAALPSPPSISAVRNGASFAVNAPLAPGSFASVLGSSFGPQDQLTGFPATSFGGVSVTFNGIKAPLLHLIASAGQIDLLVPSELPEGGSVAVKVATPDGASPDFTVRMAAAAPGVFYVPSLANPSRYNAAALFANTAWSVMPDALAQELKIPGNCRAARINAAAICGEPARPGDSIQIYVTGLGKTIPPLATGAVAPANGNPLYLTAQPPAVTIGGVPAPVLFSGLAPGYAGLYQLNVLVPSAAPAGDDIPLAVTMPNGQSDASTTIAIRP